jgi:hypothetical protein
MNGLLWTILIMAALVAMVVTITWWLNSPPRKRK